MDGLAHIDGFGGLDLSKAVGFADLNARSRDLRSVISALLPGSEAEITD
jgi:hypothetical protein